MVGTAGQAGGELDRKPLHQGVEGHIIGLHRLAVGDGARLVQGQEIKLAPTFQVHPALDQDALAGCRRQATDDGNRCRDHQRTRAGHDQQHQRPVDPIEPHTAHQQRRDHRHGQCKGKHGWRVDA
ncbi:hypothetical protein D9M73_189500 [compost metagenome]